MTNVPNRLMNVPPNKIHAGGGSVRRFSRRDLVKLDPQPHAQVREDGAEECAHAVPDDVIDVRDATGEEVLERLDQAGEGQAAEGCQDVRLQRGALDAIERDEEKEAEGHEQ